MVAVIDLENSAKISEVSISFLQVVNHLVSFPEEVHLYTSEDGKNYEKQKSLKTQKPISEGSKINDIEDFVFDFDPLETRFLKIEARSIKSMPAWHHGTGLPSWIFADEIIVK